MLIQAKKELSPERAGIWNIAAAQNFGTADPHQAY
jgi:hypothetical protein